MKPKSIGIIGGAGPLAGAFLLERILSLSGKKYGCCRDADFPKIFLISFPFSEMLVTDIDIAKLRKELSECLHQLRRNGASVLAIACNTLHAFLDEKDALDDLVHLPRTLAAEISLPDKPLIFGTSTSARFELYKKLFPCTYPDSETQDQIDKIINQILRGVDSQIILEKLEKLLRAQVANTVILGCTELSLYAARLSLSNKCILDPLEIVANKILEKSFKKKR